MQPAAQTPVTPAPQMSTPAAPVTVNVNGTAPVSTATPQPNAAAGATPQAAGGPTTQGNGSVVDLLNSAGQDSSFAARQQLAQQYGIQGYTGTAAQNQELSKKYTDAFNANKGQPVPQSGAQARSALDTYFQDAAQTVQEDPQKNFFDQYMSMNPVVKTLYDQVNQELSTPTTTQTFKEEYAKAFADTTNPAGTPGDSLSEEQMQYMNIKNIMDGTEDDIRDEITKAGGFATESQVQALTGARNKTLLKQANILQQSMALKQDYVDQLMQFSKLDRQQVNDDVDRKLGLTQKLADIQEKVTNAATDNYKNLVSKIGYDGLANALQGNEAGQSLAEKALGLPKGILSDPNKTQFLSPATDKKPYQFVSATDNQAGGVFDPNTGTFTARGGSGGTGSGIGGGSAPTTAAKNALSIILGSGKFTKDQTAQITNAINNGQDPLIVIKNQAKNIMGQTEATQVQKYEVARDTLASIGKQLQEYYSKGGSTDIVSGNFQKMYNKLGQVGDPKLTELATQIQGNLQVYRNAISGTAYSAQEGQDISSIFPGINKTEQLNNAILRGRQTLFDDVIDSNYRAALGSTYDALKAAENVNTKTPAGSIIIVQGKQYKVGADGDTLEPVGAASIDWNKLQLK